MDIIKVTSQTITRPNDTTAYASGDLIANNTTAGSVTPFAFNVGFSRGLKVHKVALTKSTTTSANTTLRFHLYTDSPTCSNGDNGAWLTTLAGWEGCFDLVGTGQTFSASHTCVGIYTNNSLAQPFFMVSDIDGYVYGLLEARAAYAPGAQETFYVTLYGEAYS